MKKLTVYKGLYMLLKTMKTILTTTLFAALLLFTNANNDDGAQCIKATRAGVFPYGDERARADFCVRMVDILTGFANAGNLDKFCKVDETKIDTAVNATQNIAVSQDETTGEYSGDATEILNAYTLFNEAIECDNADATFEEIKAAVEKQLKDNNLVVKTTLLSDTAAKAKDFAHDNFEELFIAGRVASALEDLKREQSGAESSINAANSGITDFFNSLLHTVKSQMATVTERRTGTGKVTATDIQSALAAVQQKVSEVDSQLANGENFAKAVKSSIESNLELTRQFELVKNESKEKVSAARGAYISELDGIMTDAWDNFQRLSDASDATFDPNA